MATRSKSLGIAFLLGGDMVLYTCPQGFRTIVKSVALRHGSSTPMAAAWYIRSEPAGSDMYIFNDPAVAGQTVFGGQCWHVMEPGWQLHAAIGGENAFIGASGAELVIEL